MRLWTEPRATPKNEEAISSEISHELQRMLLGRSVSITIREGNTLTST
jgi:hypothetical protein